MLRILRGSAFRVYGFRVCFGVQHLVFAGFRVILS